SRQLTDWGEPPIDFPDRLFRTVDALKKIGKAHGASASQVALAWLLTRPTVTSVIVGARSDKQLTDNLAAADLVLSDDEVAKLEVTEPHRRITDAVLDTRGDGGQLLGVRAWRDNQELLAAPSPDLVLGTQHRTGAARDLAQHLVAGSVPVRVVDVLEPVDVEQ